MGGPNASREANPFDQFDEAPGGDEDLTLEGVLRSAGVAPREVWPQSRHDRMAAAMRPFVQQSGLAVADFDDPPERIASWAYGVAGRAVGYEPTWVRFIRPDLGRGAVFILHSPHPDNEAELIVIAERGVLNRRLIADACRWAFYGLSLGRVVLRIPADRPDLSDLARRARFKHEGTARRFYRGTVDAQLWAMTGPDCPWLAPRHLIVAAADALPSPSSTKVH